MVIKQKDKLIHDLPTVEETTAIMEQKHPESTETALQSNKTQETINDN